MNFLEDFLHDLFKPLLLFFYSNPEGGLRVSLCHLPGSMYLLVVIGWHGGESSPKSSRRRLATSLALWLHAGRAGLYRAGESHVRARRRDSAASRPAGRC
jgi:hypothetical protein